MLPEIRDEETFGEKNEEEKKNQSIRKRWQDFLGGLVVRNLPANAGNMGWFPGP